MRKLMAIVLVLTMCLPLGGCREADKEKTAFIVNSSNDIYIGLSYPIEKYKDSTGFGHGVDLALQEINDGGGILHRKVQLVKKDDQGSAIIGAEIAQSFVDDKRIAAVIGHWNSRVSLAAAGVYNNAGLLMISPASTSPELTLKGYHTIFRNIPNDILIGQKMAEYAVKSGYRKTVIYYADDDYGMGLANAFEDQGKALGLEVVDRVPGTDDSQIPHLIDKWKAFEYDSIFVAEVMPEAGDFIMKARTAGATAPIIGATGIDRMNFISSLEEYAEGMVMPTVFNPADTRPEVRQFTDKYTRHFGSEPDSWAVLGYEALHLLAWSMEKADSPLPSKTSAALKGLSGWQGISGNLSVDCNGDINGTNIFIKVVKNGQYEFLE